LESALCRRRCAQECYVVPGLVNVLQRTKWSSVSIIVLWYEYVWVRIVGWLEDSKGVCKVRILGVCSVRCARLCTTGEKMTYSDADGMFGRSSKRDDDGDEGLLTGPRVGDLGCSKRAAQVALREKGLDLF
jgi:hypothetical protein